jgi:hypothetical protein
MSGVEDQRRSRERCFAKGKDGPVAPAPPPSQTSTPAGNLDPSQTSHVSALLKRAAYFPLFSVPNPDRQNIPLPSPRNPERLIGMKVFEQMHRFDIRAEEPSAAEGLRAVNRVGQPVADISIDWRVIPDDFVAAPGVLPPPTELDPTRSQRFAMYDGHFNWLDREGSSFRGFGAGRTFPTVVDGQPQLRIGAVVDILEGFGRLSGLRGNGVVNGFITPPNNLALNIMLRLMDPSRRLRATSRLSPLRQVPFPDPTATFLVCLGEADPDNPITLNMQPDGRVTGASVHELLRLVRIDFDVGTSHGMRSRTSDGPVVGSLSFNLIFDSRDRRVPTPFRTTDAVFTFFSREGRTVGTLNANIVEGRGFMSELEGVPPPVVRVVGFGPFLGGSGQFGGVQGMLSINGIISISARTPSILYVLRISDPEGKFRRAWS